MAAHRSSLGLVEDRIRFEVFAVGAIVGPNVASDVGAVADAIVADHRAAEIAEHRFASLDSALTGVMMRTGGVLPGGDDGEIHASMALLENLASEFGRDRRLGLPDERDLATLQPGGDPIDGGPGLKTGDLLGVLHLPDRARDARCPANEVLGIWLVRSTRKPAHMWSPMATVSAAPARSAIFAIGSSVSPHGAIEKISGRS